MPIRFPAFFLLALFVATVAAYWGVGGCDFVAYDDPAYVARNPMVNQGLRSAAVLWAFSAVHGANWHPLTSLSHMLDCTLFGLAPGAHHWVNLGWHLLNSALVFLVWTRLFAGPQGRWAAAAVAGLFALHPLHVESVAWISERKDVLSTAAWLAAVLGYLRWVENPSHLRWMLVVSGTLCALLAKPMAVTLPCTLLLLDFWPLRRWPARSWAILLREKWLLFTLAAGACAATLWAQKAEDALGWGSQHLDPTARLSNALVAYVRYLGKMFWPGAMSPLYPHPGAWPWWAVLGALVLLGTLSWVVWQQRRSRPWLLFGWCWFLGTLVPVIGLIQVGAQSIADRYTYVPLLGIFTMLGGGVAVWASRAPRSVAVGLGVVLLICGVRTAQQTSIWKDGLRLVEAMQVTAGEHSLVYREKAAALGFAGHPETEVILALERALALAPDNPQTLNELGIHFGKAGRPEDSRRYLERLVEVLPRSAAARANLGSAYLQQANKPAAIIQLERALQLDHDDVLANRLLAQIRAGEGRWEEARALLFTAVRADRWDTLARNELGVVEISLNRVAEGIATLEKALWIDPGNQPAAMNLAIARDRLRSP